MHSVLAGLIAVVWRTCRAAFWFCVGVGWVAAVALYVETAAAQPQCTSTVTSPAEFAQACEEMQQTWCEGPNATWECSNSGCVAWVNGPNWVQAVVPGCVRTQNGLYPNSLGFVGTCPEAGSDGPTYGGYFTESGAPPSSCSGPCQVEPDGAEVCLPQPDGSFYCAGGTQYTGDTCAPTPTQPNLSNPPPETCPPESQVDGKCISVSDTDGDPSSSPTEPSICLGGTDLCNEIPPNPNASADCEQNPTSAICVGSANSPSAPHPAAPYPPNQPPDHSTSASTSAGPVPVDIYGPPDGNSAGPPDGNGQCPTGTSLSGGQCVCPSGQSWGGDSCYNDDDSDPDGVCNEQAQNDPDCEEGDGREGENGNCQAPPACEGDGIDCSVVYQTWKTRCMLEESEDAPTINLDGDPLEEYGGADAFFETVEDEGPGGLNQSGFGLGGSCPAAPPPVQVLGASVSIPAVWCSLGFLYYITIGIAFFIAARVIMGGGD